MFDYYDQEPQQYNYQRGHPIISIALWTLVGAWVGDKVEKLYRRYKERKQQNARI